MESLYAESSVKQKTTGKAIALKTVFIIGVILLLGIGFLSRSTLMLMLSLVVLVAVIWYWPRFKVEWEYVFCDGQLDFDQILGGEKRKNKLRIELEDADVIAPMDSHKMDGYRHLAVRDFSSLKEDAEVYGIVTRPDPKGDKLVLIFEPSKKMLDMIQTKFPGKTEVKQ